MELKNKRIKVIKCYCCGCFTIEEIFEICPICIWTYDETQHFYPNMIGGANSVSLIQARKNYRKIGVSNKRLKEFARKPKKSEIIKREKPKKYKNKRKF